MKTSEMAQKIKDLVDELPADDLLDLYNYCFRMTNPLSEGEVEIDEP